MEEYPPADGQQAPVHPPRPFLKRKTAKIVVQEKLVQPIKPKGKSKIDCWHKDSDTNVIYGNKVKKNNRRSLLKKKQPDEIDPYQNMGEGDVSY